MHLKCVLVSGRFSNRNFFVPVLQFVFGWIYEFDRTLWRKHDHPQPATAASDPTVGVQVPEYFGPTLLVLVVKLRANYWKSRCSSVYSLSVCPSLIRYCAALDTVLGGHVTVGGTKQKRLFHEFLSLTMSSGKFQVHHNSLGRLTLNCHHFAFML